jgi:thioredoxin reductase
VVLDTGQGRNHTAVHSRGFPTQDGVATAAWRDRAHAEVEDYGVLVLDEQAHTICDDLALTTAGGRTLRARALLVATGARDELPHVQGLQER